MTVPLTVTTAAPAKANVACPVALPLAPKKRPLPRDDDIAEINRARTLPERPEVGGVLLHHEPASVLELERTEVAGAIAARTEPLQW